MTGVDPSMRIVREGIFAAVVNLISFDPLPEAFAIANASRYGLQTGFYTSSIAKGLQAARRLDVGGVIINGTSSTRPRRNALRRRQGQPVRSRGARLGDR